MREDSCGLHLHNLSVSGMASVEQSVKSQFARVFSSPDWLLFKKIAESNLSEAAKLRMADMPIEPSLALLARNARKRLLIGVGVELLLKAIYLKQGYMINKPPKASPFKFPFSAHETVGTQLVADETFKLNELIENLPSVVTLHDKDLTLRGLRIAKVFRNKEGHGVTSTHIFDASNYTDIAHSLTALYWVAFHERLTVQFSMAENETAIWEIA